MARHSLTIEPRNLPELTLTIPGIAGKVGDVVGPWRRLLGRSGPAAGLRRGSASRLPSLCLEAAESRIWTPAAPALDSGASTQRSCSRSSSTQQAAPRSYNVSYLASSAWDGQGDFEEAPEVDWRALAGCENFLFFLKKPSH